MIVGKEYSYYHKAVVVSYYNEEGKIDYVIKKMPESDLYNWKTSSKPTPHRNWDQKFVKPVKSQRSLSQFRVEEIIIDDFTEDEKAKIYNTEWFPQKIYCDIEIKLEDNTFPDPELAEREVNLLTFVNEKDTVYVLSTMKDMGKEELMKIQDETNEYFEDFPNTFEIKYLYFDEEEKLLRFFFHKILPKVAFITGWNFTGFDWKYLMNRCQNIGINATEALPSRKVKSRNKLPIHTGILDYMEVFDKLKPFKVVDNLKLDYISHLVLGTRKLQHSYESMLEQQKDVFNFVKYNIIDTILVKLIEDKLKLLEVAFAIAGVAQAEVSKVFSPVYITEMLMCREFLKKNLKMAADHKPMISDKGYTGAYVMPPIPGYYKYVACYDFASMYPSIQRQYNISPESYLGKTHQLQLTGEEITTKNETAFDGKYDSVARVILSRLYGERVDTKTIMKNLKKALPG